jgi:hypothetical protein
VSGATDASKDSNNPIFCAVSDATAASDTENPRSCKQTIKLFVAATGTEDREFESRQGVRF